MANYTDCDSMNVDGRVVSTVQGILLGRVATLPTPTQDYTGITVYNAEDGVFYVCDGTKWNVATLMATNGYDEDEVAKVFVRKTAIITNEGAGDSAGITDQNPLTLKTYVLDAINSVSAYYITKNAQGEPFGTYAELMASTEVYSGGTVRVPTRNDYCIVLQDESALGNGDSSRYIYTSDGDTYDPAGWQFQYTYNRQFTQAQIDALDSGINATRVAKYDAYEGRIETAMSYIADAEADISMLRTDLNDAVGRIATNEQGIDDLVLETTQIQGAVTTLGDRVTAVEDGKQDKLTFDNTPTINSGNPVTSGGVFVSLQTKENTLDADRKRKITISDADPTGGSDGDIWLKY